MKTKHTQKHHNKEQLDLFPTLNGAQSNKATAAHALSLNTHHKELNQRTEHSLLMEPSL
jgi:hypothetical protein